MDYAGFLRAHPLRGANMMWLLGAGASAASNIPTASDMIWDFKRRLYCSHNRTPLAACQDLSDPSLRYRIQTYITNEGHYPPADTDEEYAAFFAAALPNEADRQRYIDDSVAQARPSFGHLSLAGLCKVGAANIIWTTNFDTVLEDALQKILGTSAATTVADLDRPHLARDAYNNSRWPLLIKLHGDFRSRQLKNTQEELQQQDRQLRDLLLLACKTRGLAVVGYSGRDQSIMNTLLEAAREGGGFPHGLFWFSRSGGWLSPSVGELIQAVNTEDSEAHVIEIGSFDELLGDVLQAQPDIPIELNDALRPERPRVTDAPSQAPGSGWPVVRLNCLPVLSHPQQARLIDCDIGGTAEVRQAIDDAEIDAIGVRSRGGVLAFGSDRDLRSAFESRKIRSFDLAPILADRLTYESSQHGLLYDAIKLAIIRAHSYLRAGRSRRSHALYVPPEHADARELAPVRSITRQLSGVIPRTNLRWSEGVRLKLEHKLEQLWLVVVPIIWADAVDHEDADARAIMDLRMDFIRSRVATRYNATWNGLVDAWINVLIAQPDERTFRAFGIGDGIDAEFSVGRITGFSRFP